MRILVSGYCPHGKSGYGLQTQFLFEIFSKKGYDAGFIFWDMRERDDRATMTYADFSKKSFEKEVHENAQVYIPRRPLSHRDNYYWDDMSWAVQDFHPSHIVTIHDIWTIAPIWKPFDVPMYGWIPIHYDPPELQTIVNLRNYETVWSLSLWGKGILENYHSDVVYIPHVIDDIYFDGIFSNTTRKKQIRNRLGIPENAYVYLMVARNTEKSNRKGFDAALQAFTFYKRFKNPVAHLHMHVNIKGAIDVQELAKQLDIGDHITCSDQTMLHNYEFSTKYLRDLYLMSDVLLCTSAAEGFGLPVVEAQCCGIPVIATNCTAISENVGLGRLSDPEHPIRGNPGSFSKPSANNIAIDMIDLERNPPSVMEKNGIRTYMAYRFNKNTITQDIELAFGRTHDVKMFFMPHSVDTHYVDDSFITCDGCRMFGGKYEYTLADDETQTYVKTSKPLEYAVYGSSGDYLLVKRDDGTCQLISGESVVCDADETWMLGELDGVPVYAKRSKRSKRSKLHLVLTEINGNKEHSVSLPTLDQQVKEVCMYKQYVVMTTNDSDVWIYDVSSKRLQKVNMVSPMTSTSCVVIRDDEIRIYGMVSDKGCVKILRYKDLTIDPESL